MCFSFARIDVTLMILNYREETGIKAPVSVTVSAGALSGAAPSGVGV